MPRTASDGDVQVGDVPPVQVLLAGAHLPPLAERPVLGVKAGQGLHGEIEDQFEMRHAPGRLAALEGHHHLFLAASLRVFLAFKR